jgi:type IV pilus assembly protein PilV
MLNDQKGFILLEALVAVAIFAFGFLALMGMQAASIKQATQAKYRNDAAFLANQIISQIMVDQNNFAAYGGATATKTAWQTQVGATLPNGTGTVDVVAAERTVNVTVKWHAANESVDHQYVTSSQIMTPCYDPATLSTVC